MNVGLAMYLFFILFYVNLLLRCYYSHLTGNQSKTVNNALGVVE
jgi:hypothetical protein